MYNLIYCSQYYEKFYLWCSFKLSESEKLNNLLKLFNMPGCFPNKCLMNKKKKQFQAGNHQCQLAQNQNRSLRAKDMLFQKYLKIGRNWIGREGDKELTLLVE